jgi:hypothetical protein
MCGRQLQILRPPLLRRLAAGARARYRHRRSARAAAKSTSLADQSGLSGLAAPLATFDHVRMSALVTATGYGVASTNLALSAEI